MLSMRSLNIKIGENMIGLGFFFFFFIVLNFLDRIHDATFHTSYYSIYTCFVFSLIPATLIELGFRRLLKKYCH